MLLLTGADPDELATMATGLFLHNLIDGRSAQVLVMQDQRVKDAFDTHVHYQLTMNPAEALNLANVAWNTIQKGAYPQSRALHAFKQLTDLYLRAGYCQRDLHKIVSRVRSSNRSARVRLDFITPPKLNMDAKNGHFQKESHLPNHHFGIRKDCS